MPLTYATSRLGRLADVAFRRRRLVLLAWVAALVVTLVLSAQLKGRVDHRLLDPWVGLARRRPASPRPLPRALARHRRRRLEGRGGRPVA